MRTPLNCFKAYDVRGKLGEELNEEIAYRIGRACAQSLGADTIVIGFDARETSLPLSKAATAGIRDAGCDVIEIGLSGTEEVYWAVSEFNSDAGIEITASHNPINYNGMKIVKSSSRPLSEKEFSEIKLLSEEGVFLNSQTTGDIYCKRKEARVSYLNKITSFVDLKKLKRLKIVINSGNGAAGPVIDDLREILHTKGVDVNFVLVNHKPDPTFPNGIPNPLIVENQFITADVVKREKADFGVAFDGDFDRCFLFDHLGKFVPGEYIVGLLSEIFLRKSPGSAIVHDPRVIWNTVNTINSSGGHSYLSKTGHAFIKTAMREADAIYGGEISAHHYFRDFAYCDSGMIPWLLLWEVISKKNIKLADLIFERRQMFPSSGEINFSVADPENCIKSLKKLYAKSSNKIDELDGLSLSFDTWRFNARKSNTEPLVRLNIETRQDELLLKKKIIELSKTIEEA